MSTLDQVKRDALRPYVTGRTVHDLGAGDLEEAHALISLGAVRVVAIDRNPMPEPIVNGIQREVCHFDEWQHDGVIHVSFLGWPANWDTGVLRLLRSSEYVIYHGKCTDGTMCGYPAMWHHLLNREVLVHVHSRASILIVYGPGAIVREPLPEERCGMDLVRQHSYNTAYLGE